MAYLQVTYFAEPLLRSTTFSLILPNDGMKMSIEGNKNYEREMKTLYLLNGFFGSSLDWAHRGLAEEMASKYNIAIVLPSGENSFYVNSKGMGSNYADFIGRDLVNYVHKTFGLSNKREDVFVGGLSMGGFGAIHTALSFPEQFGGAFGLSSGLIINKIKGLEPGMKYEMADFDTYTRIFGELAGLDTSEVNPEYLVKRLKEEGREIPPIYMSCGTEDFLIEQNREFRDFLSREGVAFTYEESSGVHDWKYWREHLEPAIKWMLGL